MSDVRLVPVSRELRNDAAWRTGYIRSLPDAYDTAFPAAELRERLAEAVFNDSLRSDRIAGPYDIAYIVLRVLGIETTR